MIHWYVQNNKMDENEAMGRYSEFSMHKISLSPRSSSVPATFGCLEREHKGSEIVPNFMILSNEIAAGLSIVGVTRLRQHDMETV